MFAKNEKELEILIQAVRIHSQHLGMEFGIERCSMLIMKNREWYKTEIIELPKQEKKEPSKLKKNLGEKIQKISQKNEKANLNQTI